MIFQHAGTVLNRIDTWNIVTTFNTKLIWQKIDSLKQLQSAIERQWSNLPTYSHNSTKIEQHLKSMSENLKRETDNYKILMSQDINQLETNLQNLEDSTALFQKNSRTKRAVLRFGSKVLKFLYGTPDVDDAEDYNAKFEELYKNQHQQKELDEANIRVAKDIFNILNITASKTNNNFLHINQSLSTLNDNLQNLNTDVILLTYRTEITNLFHRFQSMITILYEDIDALQNAILFSRKNVIHPHIINEKSLKSTLASIKLDDNRKWISDISSNEIKLLINNCELETYSLPKQILFIIKVPVVESTIYSIYLCFPLPILLSNDTYFYIHPFSQYFIIDAAKSQYCYLNDLYHCTTILSNHYMCVLDNLYRAAAQSCEFQLMDGQSSNCHFQVSAFSPSIWHQIAPNQWLYVIRSRTTLTVHDSLSSHVQQFNLPPSGIITLPSGTTGYTTHHVLHSGKSNSTTIQGILHLPVIDMPTFTLPPVLPGYKLPEIGTLNIEEIQKSHETFEKAHEHFNFTFEHEDTKKSTSSNFSFLSWVFSSISIVTWIIIILGCCLFYHYFSNIKTLATSFTSPVGFVQNEMIPWFNQRRSSLRSNRVKHERPEAVYSSIDRRIPTPDFREELKNELASNSKSKT
ncbi:unnamed protein product [Brugia timori]|uniref:Envelope fusion protein n=1 Tax=Brugia timori TaxID=42155 RepID=A0A0R3QU09_9BILA|nr:unnamed protein product [Brugia timori]